MGLNLMTLPSELRQEIIRLAIWHECALDRMVIPEGRVRSSKKQDQDADKDDDGDQDKDDEEDEDEDEEGDEHQAANHLELVAMHWDKRRDAVLRYEIQGFCGYISTYSLAKPYVADNMTTARNLRLLFNRIINDDVYRGLKCLRDHLKIHRTACCAESSRSRMHERYTSGPDVAECSVLKEFKERKQVWQHDLQNLRKELVDIDTLLSIARPSPLPSGDGQKPRWEVSHVVSREYKCTKRRPQGRLEYRLRFAGYPPKCDRWVTADEYADDPAVIKYDAENPLADAYLPKKPRGPAKVRNGYPVFNKVNVLKMECRDCGGVAVDDEDVASHDLRFFVQPPGTNIEPRWIPQQEMKRWYPEEYDTCIRSVPDGAERDTNGRLTREIERIVDSEIRVRPGEFQPSTQYRVRWKGLAPRDDTWMRLVELCGEYRDALNDFYAEQIRKGRLLPGMCCSGD